MKISISTKSHETRVALEGDLVESIEQIFDGLKGKLKGAKKIVFNCAKIRRINSMGIVKWRRFLCTFDALHEVEFVQCSTSFMGVLGMLPVLIGNGKIGSFFVPLRCRPCNKSQEVLVKGVDFSRDKRLPSPQCVSCGEPMENEVELDELLAHLGHMKR